MTELLGGIIGGLGLFTVGMWFLTENLKTLASRRLRSTAQRWTANPFKGLVWGALAGGITQSMSALTFIVVSILRSGLITTKGALVLILGGGVGVSALVMIVTFDIKLIALYVLGITGMIVVTDKLPRYRPIAGSLLGGAMIILGLALLKDAAAPLALQPWFRNMVEGTGDSLVLAFLVAALLTTIVQSSSAVCVFAISLATVGVISVDQAIMTIYGSCIGSGIILYLLSTSLTGRSRQVAMYMVLYNVLVCAVLVPMFYCELYLDIPLMKAVVLAVDLHLDQQLALVFILLAVLPVPLMLAGLALSVRILEKLWPASQFDEMSRTRFIHDHATVDVDTALVLVDLEQKSVLKQQSQYFEMVRQQTGVKPIRVATREVLAEINDFLSDLQTRHPIQGVEGRNALVNRQKLLSWLEEALGVMCQTLLDLESRHALHRFRTSICEGVDSVLLSLLDALETNDELSWYIARQLTRDRGAMMRKIRNEYLEMDPPLGKSELLSILLITNTVEEVFFLLSKLESDFNTFLSADEHVPHLVHVPEA